MNVYGNGTEGTDGECGDGGDDYDGEYELCC